MTCISAIDCHMHNRTYLMAFHGINTKALHQLIVTNGHIHAINLRSHSVSTDLFHIRYPALVDLSAICLADTLADRMRRITLC